MNVVAAQQGVSIAPGKSPKQWLAIKIVVLGVLVLAAGVYAACNAWKFPVELPLNTSVELQKLAQSVGALLAWLFVVALFVERAVEVIIMVFRDQAADLLDQTEDEIRRKLKTATDNVDMLNAKDPPATAQEKEAAAQAVAEAQQELADAERVTIRYRSDTKKIAVLTSFVLGMLVSFAGVHGLSNILAPANLKDDGLVGLFKVLDIFITGTMIAGGSEGVHRMANAFTSTMDSLSARADQTQKNLKANS